MEDAAFCRGPGEGGKVCVYNAVHAQVVIVGPPIRVNPAL